MACRIQVSHWAALLIFHLLFSLIGATPFQTTAVTSNLLDEAPTTFITVPTAAAPNGKHQLLSTLGKTSSIAARAEGDVSHWYLTCAGDDKLSIQFCEQRKYGYFCQSNAKIDNTGEEYVLCQAGCECKREPIPACVYLHGYCFNALNEPDSDNNNTNGLPDTFDDSSAQTNADGPDDASSHVVDNTSSPQQTIDTGVDDPTPVMHHRDHSALAVMERDSKQPMHEWAIVCVDRTITNLCTKAPYNYSCTKKGQVDSRAEDLFCTDVCKCVSLNPKPTCIPNLLGTICVNAPMEAGGPEVDVSATGREAALQLRQRATEQPAHQYAIVCIKREWTRICAGQPYKYSCTKNGKVDKEKLDVSCEAICGCVDMDRASGCFLNAAFLSTCLDGSERPDSSRAHDLDSTSDEPALSASRRTFYQPKMYCGVDGILDTTLTKFCLEHEYSCKHTVFDGRGKSILQPKLADIASCANNCHCFNEPLGHKGNSEISQELEPRAQTEQQQTADVSEVQGAGVSVYYCIMQTQPYTFEIDLRMVEFCSNENFYCSNDPPPGVKGFAPITPPNPDKYPRCIDHCRCIHFDFQDRNQPRSEIDLIRRTEVAQDAEPKDLSKDEVTPTLATASEFKLTCFVNYNITAYCQRFLGYRCDESGNHVPGESADADCDAGCRCQMTQRHEEENSESGRLFGQKTAVANSAPPQGVPTQTVDQYTLNCGNYQGGPVYCMAPERGYFCNAKMELVRTSTGSSVGVTYCNNFCTCQFKYARPCINDFGAPWCYEWWDGTVRDAMRVDYALGLVKDVYILPNGTLMLDKAENGFPDWIQGSGHGTA